MANQIPPPFSRAARPTDLASRQERSVPAKLFLDLAHRGFSLTRDGDTLVLEPRHRLTTEDVPLVQEHAAALLKIVAIEHGHFEKGME